MKHDVPILVAEKNWEGCGGLAMTDEIKVTIAAQIAILVLGLRQRYFDAVLSILVYPDAYLAPDRQSAGAGVVLEGDSAREGEAWYRGPVILSWPDVLSGGRGEDRGHNLVFHEFAHQLDMLNGRVADGVPPLSSAARCDEWRRTMHGAYERLCRDCEDGRSRVLDCYGTTNEAEFFAVATEAFFENATRLNRHSPELYAMFRRFYGQDPASRPRRDQSKPPRT